jgi:hypothetical protein
MADDIQRSRGRPVNYKMDRGNVPTDFGPFYGVVKNNIDPTRSGRLEVYIATFADGDSEDSSKWTTVSYLPGFFGYTGNYAGSSGNGSYPGNTNSYGMWFTPPDIGVVVLCIFANGDRSQGFYIGVVPEQTVGYMVPAIGASKHFSTDNTNQKSYFEGASQLPVTEININNIGYEEDGKFVDKPKPVQSVSAAVMFQQGIVKDIARGPIASSSQRESPSQCYGISTPGTAIYQGGMTPQNIKSKADSNSLKPSDMRVIGRMGGHTFVMDDGDIDGKDKLVRFRTSSGHQILMSDSDNFMYFIHANGQTWIELGSEGTVDVYASNSVNFRTQGDINLHADQDINMYAKRNINIKSTENTQIEATKTMVLTAKDKMTVYSKAGIGVKSDGSIALQSSNGSWAGGGSISLNAGGIDLNSGSADSVSAPKALEETTLDDTEFDNSTGWKVNQGSLKSIVSRAPTHEPYPWHNKGVKTKVKFEPGTPPPPPGAVPIPAGVEITAK